MNERQKSEILMLAECSMNIMETARRLHFHRNTVYCHMDEIYDETGLNPRNFYDLIKLVELAKS